MKPVCERSAEVRDALQEALGAECARISDADLQKVSKLDPTLRIHSVAPGDFDGLSNLGDLNLYLPDGGALPVGVFDSLNSLTILHLATNHLSLEPGSFRGLRNLRSLFVGFSDDQTTPPHPGTFEGMPRLVEMWYSNAAIAAPGMFDGLDSVRYLNVLGEIAHIPAGALRGLPNLRRLVVDAGADDGTAPTTVEPGLFDGLSNLERLELSDLDEVPLGLFAGLSSLRGLALTYNAFTSLPPGVFEDFFLARLSLPRQFRAALGS